MSVTTPSTTHYSPGVLSLIPLFYVGWADNVLSPTEIGLIRKHIDSFDFLSEKDKKLLASWSNPKKVPSPQLFKEWVELIRAAAQSVSPEGKQSLAKLGIEMARKGAPEGSDQTWSDPKTQAALEDLETAIGVANLADFRNLFSVAQREKMAANLQDTPSFDIQKMTAILDDDYAEDRNRLKTLLSDPVFKYQTLPDKEDYRNQILHWCKILADNGYGAISYPTAYGGRDNMGAYAAVFETLGYHDLSLTIKFGVQFGLFGGSVMWLGTQEHHDKYLEDIGSMKLAGCFAMTETGHGSNVRNLETTAVYDAATDELIIHSPTEKAGKEYIGNALHGRMATVFAQLIVNGSNHGVHAVLVPLRDENHQELPGVRVVDCGYKLGLNGVDNGRIWFNQVRVPRGNLLNRFGNIDAQGNYSSPIENPSRRFFTMLGTLVGGRVCVPRAGLSATKAGLTIAIKYALRRRQFAPSENEPETLLLDYPSHQLRLMPRLAKTYALDFALTYLTKRYVERSEEDIREIETMAAGLKSYATWFTTSTLQECREACGGKGYLSENRFGTLKADTEIFTTFEGDNTVLMQLVAKGLLSNFKAEFHNEGYRAVLRFLVEQVSSKLNEFNPFFTRNVETEHLCDFEFHLEAFRFRERQIVISIANRMRALIKRQMKAYDAFLRCQTQMLILAQAYTERLVLEQFVLAVKNCEDEACQKSLTKLCQLFALSTLDNNRAWFLEAEYMQAVKTKAIRKMVAKLSQEVRQEAAFLVDAFAIPASCLDAEIIR